MPQGKSMKGIANYGQAMHVRKFSAEFSVELAFQCGRS
jgi:hypothetical protein